MHGRNLSKWRLGGVEANPRGQSLYNLDRPGRFIAPLSDVLLLPNPRRFSFHGFIGQDTSGRCRFPTPENLFRNVLLVETSSAS
jgi:hypothetical protein